MMKYMKVAIVLVVSFILVFTFSTPSQSPNLKLLEQLVHERVNAERQSRGLSTLGYDSHISVIAEKHSKNMAEVKFFSHIDPQGRGPYARYKVAKYDCHVRLRKQEGTGSGENLLMHNLVRKTNSVKITIFGRSYTLLPSTYLDEVDIADQIVAGWMGSRAHRKVMLLPYWKNEGLGIVFSDDEDSGEERLFVTQNFC